MTKILLVEDDNSLREIYSVRLQAERYEVISSADGEEALAAAIGNKPDLIVSDVMMPKISGFEMLDLLRSNENTKNIPVIMLTALSSEQQRERGDSLGADRYLIKSQVGIEDIIRTVHEVLGDGSEPKSTGELTDAIAHETGQATPANTTQPEAGIRAIPDKPQASSDDPIIDNPSITGTNFPPKSVTPPVPSSEQTAEDIVNSVVNQSLPNTYQSSFNPPAATEPAQVAGQPEPSMPDTPMQVPTYNTPQPGMPTSYASATQFVADSQAPAQAPAQTSANQSMFQVFQPSTPPVASAQPVQQAPVAQPVQPAVPQQQITQPAAPQQMPQPVQPQYAAPNMQAQYAPQPTQPQQTPTQMAAAQPTANQVYPGSGSERVVAPLPGATNSTSPKIDIDSLLASAPTASMGSTFPNG